MQKYCFEHQKPVQWACCVCRKNLCLRCRMPGEKERSYCRACGREVLLKRKEQIRLDYLKGISIGLLARLIYTIEFIIVVTYFVYVMQSQGIVSSEDFRDKFIYSPLIIGVFVFHFIFPLFLRCPSCGAFFKGPFCSKCNVKASKDV